MAANFSCAPSRRTWKGPKPWPWNLLIRVKASRRKISKKFGSHSLRPKRKEKEPALAWQSVAALSKNTAARLMLKVTAERGRLYAWCFPRLQTDRRPIRNNGKH